MSDHQPGNSRCPKCGKPHWTEGICHFSDPISTTEPTPPAERPRGESDGPGCPVSAMRPAERPTPETDAAWNAPASTHVQRAHNVRDAMRNLERQLAEAIRERYNAISDWKQADTDSIRAIHERNEARQQLENTIAERDQLKRDYDEARDGHWQTLELLKNVSEQRDRFSEALDYIRYNGMTMTKEAIVAIATHGTGGAE